MTELQYDLLCVVAFLIVAVGFVLGALVVGSFVRPRRPSEEKRSSYECGERPVGGTWFNFNPRFYIIGLVFIVFDVEVAFMFPVASVYREWIEKGLGAQAYVELFAFLAILFAGLVYVWRKGDLNWIKRLDHRATPLEKGRE